jgi:FAD/FMN-containing dehydrogenase
MIINQNGCKFAIRATGHNPNPGYSNVDESGIVIDLGGLTSLTLAEDGTIHIGAGNTWGKVYAWLEERQRSAMGGRESAVGVSGFFLGGNFLNTYPPSSL